MAYMTLSSVVSGIVIQPPYLLLVPFSMSINLHLLPCHRQLSGCYQKFVSINGLLTWLRYRFKHLRFLRDRLDRRGYQFVSGPEANHRLNHYKQYELP